MIDAAKPQLAGLTLARKNRAILGSPSGERPPQVEVRACGSREYAWRYDGSDLGLVLRSPDLKAVPPGRLADFEGAKRESRIPVTVEARDWPTDPGVVSAAEPPW